MTLEVYLRIYREVRLRSGRTWEVSLRTGR